MISSAFDAFGSSKQWYIFIEADTHVSLNNLLLWLQTLDSQRAIYAGAQVLIGDTEFAHGGSGFVLSAKAASGLTRTYRERQAYWDNMLASECCGDKVMAEVLLAASPSVRLWRSFPLIQGETPASLDW